MEILDIYNLQREIRIALTKKLSGDKIWVISGTIQIKTVCPPVPRNVNIMKCTNG
jgi:hypothetical protein